MIRHIITPLGNISTFSLSVILGILIMFLLVHINLKKLSANYIGEENYIFPKIVLSGLFGYFFAGFFDSLFKFSLYGKFKLTGITFYGGLIGATITLYVSLLITHKRTKFSIKEWFDLLTIPFVVFHIFGRIGCFFGGCCYGKYTNSFLGVVFPDNEIDGIYHYGEKCYPTQLFEVVALILILLLLLKSSNKFSNYILFYSLARFIIEFFRGDERGKISSHFSPAQIISIVLFLIIIVRKGYSIYKHQRHKST